jgi:membrane protein YqaA with SNARE-associated domain
MYLKILTVAALASFEVYAAIPAGLAFSLSPWAIFIASVCGGIAGVCVAAFLGDRIRKFFAKKKVAKPKEEKPKKNGMAHKIWNRYGIIGLGLLGTMTVGAPISIAVGVGFKAPIRKLITWCCIGVIARCAIFTVVAWYGLKLV